MSTSVALAVAQMGAVLITRPGSPVFHVASRDDLTPSGRWLRRSARTVCNARTRRPLAIGRIGVTVLIGDLRWCARCWARLSALARRAQQLPNNIDQRKAYLEAAGIGSTDLVIALAVAPTLNELLAVQSIANLRFGQVCTTTTRRPVATGKAQGRWDFENEFLRRRRQLVAAERSADEIHAARTRREMQALESERARQDQIKGYQHAKHQDRINTGKYTTPWERERATSNG